MCAQVLYALTAGVAGYVSAVQYKTMGGTNWVRFSSGQLHCSLAASSVEPSMAQIMKGCQAMHQQIFLLCHLKHMNASSHFMVTLCMPLCK